MRYFIVEAWEYDMPQYVIRAATAKEAFEKLTGSDKIYVKLEHVLPIEDLDYEEDIATIGGG